LPTALDELVLALISPHPFARPTSAADVIEHLTTIAHLPPEADEPRVAYSYLQHPPLVGRTQVLAELKHALRASISGAGQIVLLEAEQGLGRTALLDHLAVEAQLAGATASMFEQPVPGFDRDHATQIVCGCLNGTAQALVTESDPRALELADELERRGGTFFASHAECIRMTYTPTAARRTRRPCTESAARSSPFREARAGPR
jgi:hypothetical protein